MINNNGTKTEKLYESSEFNVLCGVNSNYVLLLRYNKQNESKYFLSLFDYVNGQIIPINMTFKTNPRPYLTENSIYVNYNKEYELYFNIWS